MIWRRRTAKDLKIQGTWHVRRNLNYYFRKTSNGATISSKTGRLQKYWVAGEARARILRRSTPPLHAVRGDRVRGRLQQSQDDTLDDTIRARGWSTAGGSG